MKPLHIKARKDSPEISFDPNSGSFYLIGVSHPENVTTFYEPVLKWFLDFKDEIEKNGLGSQDKEITLRFFFKYINSASYKYMVTLFQLLQELFEIGVKIKIVWNYEPGDEDMAESGFELVEYSGLKAPFVCEESEELI
ncbi:MAG: hypothetical protein PWR03_2302 [Tenuifilum sp.]|uniref:DUF1987 domain-containing protein n=1 Tax=Tenuifilum thalassicum TaxID=2590900 RepID=A0A7D3XEH0_9BACT|nr:MULTISPECIES: DUF1987 domain-containing protein [Tenuifilum]MDI3528118.1 hypothetical protein [Tenuifilum sp.]QKG79927.1 DUF1987 domain-containing protein [Tenuifilum thalassicum]